MVISTATIGQLAVAFVKAQAELPLISLDKEVSYKSTRFEYASLSNIIQATKPVLAKHGLAILQFPSNSEGQVHIDTMLLHETGESLTSRISMVPLHPDDPKDIGALVTYLRRYSYGSVLGIALDGDYDATPIIEKYLATNEHKAWLRDFLTPQGLTIEIIRKVSEEMLRGNYELTEGAAMAALEVLRK